MRIAAIVSLAGTETVRVSDVEWPAVRDELIEATRDPQRAIRNRATVTLSIRLGMDDAPAVVELIHERGLEGIDLDNLVGTLVKFGVDDAVLDVLPIALERGATAAATRAWLEAWSQAGNDPKNLPHPGSGCPLSATSRILTARSWRRGARRGPRWSDASLCPSSRPTDRPSSSRGTRFGCRAGPPRFSPARCVADG